MATQTIETKWFCFRQNNSGGDFRHDPGNGIGISVLIEAIDAAHANARAEQIGLYFGGAGDCPCCGDRWIEADSYDATELPEIYGRRVRPRGADDNPYIEWELSSYMHPLNGSHVEVVMA